jgi:3-hydroxy-3-methylglutaryl CoA synthase
MINRCKDAKKRLELRKEVSVEYYVDVMKRREKGIIVNEQVFGSEQSEDVFPGTFVLDVVDERLRRKYRYVKPDVK